MGGAYLKNRDQKINVWIIRNGTSEVRRGQSVQPKDYRTEIGRLLMVRKTFASAEGASRLGGLGACSSRTFSNLKA